MFVHQIELKIEIDYIWKTRTKALIDWERDWHENLYLITDTKGVMYTCVCLHIIVLLACGIVLDLNSLIRPGLSES